MRTTSLASRRRHSIAALAVVASSVTTGAARAATQTSTWAGTSGGVWSTAANWSPTGVPNNGTNGFSDYNVIIGAPSPAVLDIDATIDSLTVNAGAQLTIGAAHTLNIKGPTITDNGIIQIDTLSSNANLNFLASTFVTGSGTIMLNDYNPNARTSCAAGVVVTQAAGHTIAGVGEIDAALVNNGVVNANYSGHTLVLQTSNMTNNSLFEATGGGTLAIGAIAITQGSTGQILSGANGTLTLTGSTIAGGTLNSAVGRSISVSGGTFNNVTVGAGANVNVTPGTTLNIGGGSLVNNGLIHVDTYSGNAAINFTSSTQLTGSGSIFIDDNNPFALMTASPGATVTQGANHTIYGLGEIDAPLINNGIVNASETRGGHTLLLQTSAMTNNNLFEATGGGILDINGIAVTQGSSGQIVANASSSVSIRSNASVIGGTIKSTIGGVINVSDATFNNVVIAAGSNVMIASGKTLNISGGTLANDGLIQVDNFTSNAALNFTTSTQLTGSGSIFLDDYNPYARITAAAGATLTQGANHTLYGVGEIDAPLINNGIVNANDVRGPRNLILQTSAMTNNNVFEATGGGILDINGITIQQSAAGQIVVGGSGSSVALRAGASVVGGKIAGPGTFTINSGTLSGVTIQPGGVVSVPNSATATFTNTVNNGAITMTGSVTASGLSGNGSLLITDDYPGIFQLAAGSGLSTQGSLSVDGGGKLDIVNNRFGINYGVGNPSPAMTVRGYLLSGRNGGAWTGPGIISSQAATNAGYSVGYADGIDGAAAGQVLLKYALSGDTDLSGAVDFADLVALAQHYNTPANAVWTQGDLDYDGAVGFSDLVLLAQNYNRTAVGASLTEAFGQDFASDFALALSLVPEPTSLAALAGFAVLAMKRRR